MKTYFLTVFSQKGENLLNDTIEAQNDEEASKIGKERLADHGYQESTHRCVSPDGRLVLFHR